MIRRAPRLGRVAMRLFDRLFRRSNGVETAESIHCPRASSAESVGERLFTVDPGAMERIVNIVDTAEMDGIQEAVAEARRREVARLRRRGIDVA